MRIENLTDKTFVLDLGVRIRAGHSVSVADSLYEQNTLLNGEIDALRSQGLVAIHGEQALLAFDLGDQKDFTLQAVAEGAAGDGITFAADYQHPLDEQDSEMVVNVVGTDIVVQMEAQGFTASIPPVLETKSTLTEGAGNARITFDSTLTGTAGDAVTVECVQETGSPNVVDTVNLPGGTAVVIHLGTDGSSDPKGSSATDIAALVNLGAGALLTAVAAPGTGADPFLLFSETPLAGGVDPVAEIPQVDAHNTTTVQSLYDTLVADSDVTDLVNVDFLGPTDTLFPPTDGTLPLTGGGDIPPDPFPDGSTNAGSGRIAYRLAATSFAGWEATDDPNLFLLDTGLHIPETGAWLDDTLALITENFDNGYQLGIAYMADGDPSVANAYTFDSQNLGDVGGFMGDIDQAPITPADTEGKALPGRIVLLLDTGGADVPGVRPENGAFIIWTGVWI